jgi:hypothetical protein
MRRKERRREEGRKKGDGRGETREEERKLREEERRSTSCIRHSCSFIKVKLLVNIVSIGIVDDFNRTQF